MHLQDLAALVLGAGPGRPQLCIAQHLADRHPGCPEMADEADPDQDTLVIVAPPAPPARGVGKQPDPLVVADGMHAQPAGFSQVSDPHRLPSTSWTTSHLRVRVRSKSTGKSTGRFTVANSTSVCRHPIRLTVQRCYSVFSGSMMSWRCAFSQASARSSSRSMRAEQPTTSAARIAAIRRSARPAARPDLLRTCLAVARPPGTSAGPAKCISTIGQHASACYPVALPAGCADAVTSPQRHSKFCTIEPETGPEKCLACLIRNLHKRTRARPRHPSQACIHPRSARSNPSEPRQHSGKTSSSRHCPLSSSPGSSGGTTGGRQ